MIAGISIIIDPVSSRGGLGLYQRSSHSSDMRAILQKFLEDHPHDPSMDDFSKKESAIVSRRRDMTDRRSTP